MDVIAALIETPSLLLTDQYHITVDDFPDRHYKILFSAIDNLAHRGVKQLDVVVIDEYLSHYPAQYQVFQSAGYGMGWVTTIQKLGTPSNFETSYQTLKKCSLLTSLKKQGYDVSYFYNKDTVLPREAEKAREHFDDADINGILDHYAVELESLRRSYGGITGVVEGHIANGMESLREELANTPAFGLPMNSAKMTAICHGRRLRKFYLRTAPSGLSKTRAAIADACRISIGKLYNPLRKQWELTHCYESVLFITTELEMSEIQTMLWAYVACVPEDHIIDNRYEQGEEERIREAIEIIKASKFYAVYIPSFDADDIENIIKRYKYEHNIGFAFVDYIFSSSKLFAEMSKQARGFNLREDQSLMVFAERLKTLANQYDIHIDSSTQANDDWKNQKNPDQSVIRGAKAIADKVDIGYVMLEPTERDREAIHAIMASNGMAFAKEPNMVYHIYKVRRGKINHVKLFLYFDFATLRTTDLFVTDRDYNLVNVDNVNVESVLDSTAVPRGDIEAISNGEFPVW